MPLYTVESRSQYARKHLGTGKSGVKTKSNFSGGVDLLCGRGPAPDRRFHGEDESGPQAPEPHETSDQERQRDRGRLQESTVHLPPQ